MSNKISDHYYKLNSNFNGTRIIDANNVSLPLCSGNVLFSVKSKSNLFNYINKSLIYNKKIDDFLQGRRGDCYLLASIKAISLTKKGTSLLMKNIRANNDGSYEITLPGAKKLKQHLEKQGKKCFITGQYKITNDALTAAKGRLGANYAIGDFETLVFELAMEAYRAELKATLEVNGIKGNDENSALRYTGGNRDTLSGGLTHDAIFILSGAKSDVYSDVKFYPLSTNDKKQTLPWVKNQDLPDIEVATKTYDRKKLNEMLDKCIGHENEYAMTVGFVLDDNNNFIQQQRRFTEKTQGFHAVTVSKVTKDYIEVINSWETKAERKRYTRQEFLEKAKMFTMTKICPHRLI